VVIDRNLQPIFLSNIPPRGGVIKGVCPLIRLPCAAYEKPTQRYGARVLVWAIPTAMTHRTRGSNWKVDCSRRCLF